MATSSNTEDLMSLIFGSSDKKQDDGETILDLVDESFEPTTATKISDVSQSNRYEDAIWTKRELLNIIEED